jgi:hypothetical protein
MIAVPPSRMHGMDMAMFIYVVLCIGIGAMMVEDLTRNGLRWSIADMLKIITLVAVMLAIGRILKSV